MNDISDNDNDISDNDNDPMGRGPGGPVPSPLWVFCFTETKFTSKNLV